MFFFCKYTPSRKTPKFTEAILLPIDIQEINTIKNNKKFRVLFSL
ncbi:hypothetical protein FLAVO9AF_280001 [Flavobacterium sp. 9AF]|nr:hypothetical protein FLAVO9AF_280001 [Flavobacterium sp. 9AF]